MEVPPGSWKMSLKLQRSRMSEVGVGLAAGPVKSGQGDRRTEGSLLGPGEEEGVDLKPRSRSMGLGTARCWGIGVPMPLGGVEVEVASDSSSRVWEESQREGLRGKGEPGTCLLAK